MFYDGNKKTAWIKGNVHLTEKDIQLTSSDLNYDLENKTAYYYSKAHIYSKQNQNKLTSIKGAYKTNLKTIYFKDSVVLEHPNYKMTSDTLNYHTKSEIAFSVALQLLNQIQIRYTATKDGMIQKMK